MNKALRQIFIDARAELIAQGDLYNAATMGVVIRKADREEVERRGRKRGEVVAVRPNEETEL